MFFLYFFLLRVRTSNYEDTLYFCSHSCFHCFLISILLIDGHQVRLRCYQHVWDWDRSSPSWCSAVSRQLPGLAPAATPPDPPAGRVLRPQAPDQCALGPSWQLLAPLLLRYHSNKSMCPEPRSWAADMFTHTQSLQLCGICWTRSKGWNLP